MARRRVGRRAGSQPTQQQHPTGRRRVKPVGETVNGRLPAGVSARPGPRHWQRPVPRLARPHLVHDDDDEWCDAVLRLQRPPHGHRHRIASPLMARSSRPGFLLTLAALERLGHSRVGITLDLYSHVTEGLQDDAVTLVDDAMADAPPQRQRAR